MLTAEICAMDLGQAVDLNGRLGLVCLNCIL